MYKRIKGGLKTAALCMLAAVFSDISNNEVFSPIKALVVFLGAFVAYEALGLIGALLKKKLDS